MRPSARPAIVVLGMHRSGTSALTGVLSRLGFALPRTPLAEATDNPEGFYESHRIVGENYLILHEEHCAWNTCLRLDPAALQSRTKPERYNRLHEILRAEYGESGAFVLKDPRLCLLLPLWFPGLVKLSTSQHVLLMLRHPAEIVRSHVVRNNLPEEEVLLNMLHHQLEAERMSRVLPRAVVLYHELLQDWRAALGPALQKAGITAPLGFDTEAARIDSFIAPSMRHHHAAGPDARLGPPTLAPLVDSSWRAFRALARDPHDEYAQTALDDIREKLARLRQGLAGVLLR